MKLLIFSMKISKKSRKRNLLQVGKGKKCIKKDRKVNGYTFNTIKTQPSFFFFCFFFFFASEVVKNIEV